MITWNNLDTLASYKALFEVEKVNLVEAMTGENGADRVKKYSVPMAAGLAYNYGAKAVDDKVLTALADLAKEAQLTEKYAALYNGEVINTGEKFTTVVQIGIGGSDLCPRAMYLALENWAKVNDTLKMKAQFISNVDPDDAAGVLSNIDLAHAIFVLVSKSGTTVEVKSNDRYSITSYQRI